MGHTTTPPERRWWKRKRFLLPAGIVLLLWVLGSCGDQPDPGALTAANAPATTVAVTTTTLPTTTAAPTTTVQPTTTRRPTPTTTRKAIAAPTTRRPTPTTRPASTCHPSYQGECLKAGIGDYDCASGSGNGPNYVQGTVRVVGPDEFDLDRDGDGWGCEA
jgi:hypothetical protein